MGQDQDRVELLYATTQNVKVWSLTGGGRLSEVKPQGAKV